MKLNSNDKRLGRSAAIALLAAGGGAGSGWLVWVATGNTAVGIGMAGPMALLLSNILQKVIK